MRVLVTLLCITYTLSSAGTSDIEELAEEIWRNVHQSEIHPKTFSQVYEEGLKNKPLWMPKDFGYDYYIDIMKHQNPSVVAPQDHFDNVDERSKLSDKHIFSNSLDLYLLNPHSQHTMPKYVYKNPDMISNQNYGKQNMETKPFHSNSKMQTDLIHFNPNKPTDPFHSNPNMQTDLIHFNPNKPTDPVHSNPNIQTDLIHFNPNKPTDLFHSNPNMQTDFFHSNPNKQTDPSHSNPNVQIAPFNSNPNRNIDTLLVDPIRTEQEPLCPGKEGVVDHRDCGHDKKDFVSHRSATPFYENLIAVQKFAAILKVHTHVSDSATILDSTPHYNAMLSALLALAELNIEPGCSNFDSQYDNLYLPTVEQSYLHGLANPKAVSSKIEQYHSLIANKMNAIKVLIEDVCIKTRLAHCNVLEERALRSNNSNLVLGAKLLRAAANLAHAYSLHTPEFLSIASEYLELWYLLKNKEKLKGFVKKINALFELMKPPSKTPCSVKTQHVFPLNHK